jgi:hypothetical protein
MPQSAGGNRAREGDTDPAVVLRGASKGTGGQMGKAPGLASVRAKTGIAPQGGERGGILDTCCQLGKDFEAEL